MEELAGLLIILGIGLFLSGPLAVILAIVLFNKLGRINSRLDKLEGKTEYGPYGVAPAKPMTPKPAAPTPAATPKAQPQPPATEKPPQKPAHHFEADGNTDSFKAIRYSAQTANNSACSKADRSCRDNESICAPQTQNRCQRGLGVETGHHRCVDRRCDYRHCRRGILPEICV